ncbi:hypothetical protein EON66_02175 [archaeon]|nr:MAG: hypothetical protein EON66_02175 [archaeon]
MVWSSRCPSLSNLVTTANVNLAHATAGGCGVTGALSSAVAYTGGRCNQTCAAGLVSIRGGVSANVVECRRGEWFDPLRGVAAGPVVCGSMCPAIAAPSSMASGSCRLVAVNWGFTAAASDMTAWYPMYKGMHAHPRR